METMTEAPVQAQTEAPAPQSTPVEAQTQVQNEAPKQAAQAPDGAQIDRASRLTEINALIAADPDKKLNDEDLSIYMEGQEGKLKPKVEESVEKPKEEVKTEPKADDPIQKAMKDLGAKSPEEIPAKIAELRKGLSGKDAQAVASLTKELEGFRQREAVFTGTSKFIEDLKAGKPGALDYLQKELGVQLPKGTESEKPFTEEADLLTDGALSRAWNREQELIKRLEQVNSRLDGNERAVQERETQQRAKSQIVDEALALASLIDETKSLPNLRNRIIDFQAGKDDPDLSPLSEVFDYVVTQNKEKGLILDPETAFYAIQGRNVAALVAKAREEGKKEAYNYKKNPSLSGIQAEDSQPKEYTAQDIANWEKDANSIPKEFFDKDMNLDPNKIPVKYRKVFGY